MSNSAGLIDKSFCTGQHPCCGDAWMVVVDLLTLGDCRMRSPGLCLDYLR